MSIEVMGGGAPSVSEWSGGWYFNSTISSSSKIVFTDSNNLPQNYLLGRFRVYKQKAGMSGIYDLLGIFEGIFQSNISGKLYGYYKEGSTSSVAQISISISTANDSATISNLIINATTAVPFITDGTYKYNFEIWGYSST